MEHEVWPVVVVSWKSKAEAFLASLGEGRISPAVQNGTHVREGARFVALLDDGSVLARGEVVAANRWGWSLAIDRLGTLDTPVKLEPSALGTVKAAVAKAKRPLVAFPVPTDGEGKPFSLAFFELASGEAAKVPPVLPLEIVATKASQLTSEIAPAPSTGAATHGTPEPDAQLMQWLPPALS